MSGGQCASIDENADEKFDLTFHLIHVHLVSALVCGELRALFSVECTDCNPPSNFVNGRSPGTVRNGNWI